jgi:nucleotide-binding universal stress UspA family protein
VEHVLHGSVALPVVAHAHCPVIVVPAAAAVSTPTRIVVGVDGSDAGRRAVEFALHTAQLCGAAVTAVLVWHVEVEGGVVVTERSSERWAAVEERYEALGHRVIDPAAARHPGVDVEIRVLHGSAAKVLLEAGADLRAELVVVGSRGRGGFRGLLLGSVSRRVVQQANCVVAVVH